MSSDEEIFDKQPRSKKAKKQRLAMDDEDEDLQEYQTRMVKFVELQNSMESRMNVGEIKYNMSHSAGNSIKQSQAKDNHSNQHAKDKKDRATVEQVLDPRTRVILVKLMNNGLFSEINGCISTGKEANVYHAATNKGISLAIKIYKTSILVFKDREKYIQGEFRFRRGYCKSNPRKLIKLWAEKEIRNLKRIYQSGIPCPEPILVKTNVLVMEFLGEGMVPAPRLRNAELTTEQLSQVYLDLIMMMRRLYHECKLIHADLSEYNLLYWKEKLWVIDVSQSIEHDHPYALDFLRRDIYNVNQYFHKNNVRTFAIKTVFDYITDINIKTSKESLEALIELNKDFDADKAKEEENVFASIYIPRTLEEMDIKHIERDLQKEEELVYSKLTGINKGEKQKASGWVNVEDKEGEEGKVDEEDEEDESDDSEESNDESSSEEDNSNDDSGSDDESDSEEGEKTEGKEAKEGAEEGEEGEKKPNRKLSDKEANKERKKKLKEEKREKRQSKMKKKDKAKLIKKTQTTKQKKKT
eukprot:CAMPEP_0176432208 /NCGR_PEP_ID=MMETSP0127-20121128/15257_1 /TAXON_ID=938130 /ORGANISM="Platyophrya macrostoma, Strain WH" /LENGTH=525 /DNA_ID=CAMNT_0017814335 /DNA_START=9 /DNA_END=1586 /DNA_ORIENTATION=+